MSEKVTELVDHYFREEYGKAVSYLTAKYGSQHLDLAEDSVQEALYKAMQTWPYAQIPKNPSGWIVTVASNKMIDHFRKTSRVDNSDHIPDRPVETQDLDLESIQDDVVKMMFACCHPSLSAEYQIILTLKILGGLSIREISRGLLKKEETVAKSYTRAKKKFQEEGIQLVLPSQAEIKSRLRTVLQVIYLLFNEGYKTTEGEELLKKDLCQEAIRLVTILTENDRTNISMCHSLLALMLFHSSRFESRVDAEGRLVTLENQDRSKWDREKIQAGLSALQRATSGAFLNEFYVQAAISGMHCEAKTYADTQWPEILGMYDTLLRISPSPVVRLNRAVALAKAKSAEDALKEIAILEKDEQMSRYYLLHAIKGDLLLEIGEDKTGRLAIEQAIALTDNQAEKEHLSARISTNH